MSRNEYYKKYYDKNKYKKHLKYIENKDKIKEYIIENNDRIKEQKRKYNFKNKDKFKKIRKPYKCDYSSHRIEIKQILLDILGGKCVNCGEFDLDVLQFDHINDDGYKDKYIKNGEVQRKRRGVDSLFALFNKNNDNFYNTYQVLCANCNMKKSTYRKALIRLEKLDIPPF